MIEIDIDDVPGLPAATPLRTRARRWLTFVAPLLIAAVLAPRATAGDGPEILATQALAMFKKALSDKDMPKLEEALIDFDAVYAKVDAKTVKKFHSSYGKLFKLKPREEYREDFSDPRDELLRTYQLALGTVFDKDGGREIILSGLKLSHIKRWPEAQSLFVEALGFRTDPKDIKSLAGYLKSDEPSVVRAAVHGLSMFSEADVDTRRSAAGPLIEALLSFSKASEKEAKKKKEDEQEAQEFFLAVEGTFYEALLKLTRQRFGSATEWAAWFKENGAGDRW